MSAIFLSHSSRDNDAAAEMRARLEDWGHRSVFLDFDPEDGIPAGRHWEKELYAELRGCRALIVLCSEHSMASNWCFAEITHARALGKHVFPVIVSRCSLPPMLTAVQVIDLTEDREDGYRRLERGLSRAGLDPSDDFGWDGSRSPYPGLAAFQEADAKVYFGRDAEVQDGLDALNRLQRFGGKRVLLVLGASGSGKSSLVRAGFIPRLKRDAQRWLVVDPIRPQQDPLGGLARALSDAFARYQSPRDEETLRSTLDAALARPEPAGRVLVELAEELRMAAGQREATVLLVIDQAEELLGYAPEERANDFLSLLRAALEAPGSPLMAAATLRSDFLSDFQTHPALREMAFEDFTLGRMAPAGFAQMIEGPASVAGVELESGLVQAMVADTDRNDALPLLAFTLRELYERYGDDRRLTVQEYRDLGRLEGSVAQAAEGVMAAQPLSPEQVDELHAAFVAMVRINEEGQYARRRVRWGDLPQGCHGVLERFVTQRLLVSDKKKKEQDRYLEVAHEALFRAWQQLKTWLEEDQHSIRLRDGLQRAAWEWHQGGRERQLLVHREARLEAAEVLARKPRFELDALTRSYLQACVDRREAIRKAEAERQRREVEQARRSAHRIAILAAWLFVVAVLAIGGGYFYYQERQVALNRLAKTHWVNGVTERDRNSDPIRASHHFMTAAELRDSANAYLAGGLLVRGARLSNILEHEDNVRDGRVVGDGRWLLTWSDDNKARLWDLASGETLATIEHQQAVRSAELSRDGERLLTASNDGTARLWDRAAGRLLKEMLHEGPVCGAAFDASERYVLTWAHDGTARLWDLQSAQPERRFEHDGRVLVATFDQAGGRVLTWGDDHTVRVWDIESEELIISVSHEDRVQHALLTPDGNGLLTTSDDGTARLWDLDDGRALLSLSHERRVWGARFDASGRWIVTWSDDHTARVWDRNDGKMFAVLSHDGPVRGAAFTADGQRVVTWSEDGGARIWPRDGQTALLTVRHKAAVFGAVLDDHERWLLTWSDDSSARVWDAHTGHALTPPLRHRERVNRAMFSADGTRIVTLSDDDSARIWQFEPVPPLVASLTHAVGVQAARLVDDERRIVTWSIDGTASSFDTSSGERLHTTQYEGVFNGARFNADGSTILTWSYDGWVRLWDSATGAPRTPRLHHEKNGLGVTGAVFSPDEQRVLSWSDDGTVRVWDTKDGRLITGLEHGGSVEGAVFSPNGNQILSWSIDGQGLIWNADDASTPTKVADSAPISVALFRADTNQLLVLGRDGGARYVDPASGQPTRTLFSHDAAIEGAALSHDGTRVLTWSDDGGARIWDSERGTALTPLMHHGRGEVLGGVFARDSRRFLTWSSDGSLRLWDGDSAQPLTPAMRHLTQVEGARFAADERRILSWDVDGTVRLWSLDLDAPKDEKPVAALEIRTGSVLDDTGELTLLSRAQWQEKKQDE